MSLLCFLPHTHTHSRILSHTHILTHTNTHTHTHTHIHTHTHTHLQAHSTRVRGDALFTVQFITHVHVSVLHVHMHTCNSRILTNYEYSNIEYVLFYSGHTIKEDNRFVIIST